MYELLVKLAKPTPRYTSYPTAPEWGPFLSQDYERSLQILKDKNHPISLYVHIPFCHSMCLFCGCSVVLNRKVENEEKYVDYLIKEIERVASKIGKKKVHQLHFGGGTPTKLSTSLFGRLFRTITQAFDIDFSKEIAIEIDPRTVFQDGGEKLRFLKSLGFNRVSFGVQDTDPRVQEAVKRRQPYEMTKWTFEEATRLRFGGINIDLIYGLPYQTQKSFQATVANIIEMRPDRIALFSYAKVPWLKAHQKAIKEETLPTLEEKFKIYSHARKTFIENGYLGIGMDHFARLEDEMACAYLTKKLGRNFQGYTVRHTEDLLGFGISAIGFVSGSYVQNIKELDGYYHHLDQGLTAAHRGKTLTEEDHLRKWVIHKLMCDFELCKGEFQNRFHIPFDFHFENSLVNLLPFEEDGLIINRKDKIIVTSLGELFIRSIASCFDAYLEKQKSQPTFSNAI